MSPRYILVVADEGVERADLVRHIGHRANLQMACSTPRVVALINPACRCIPVADAGCVVGTLFHRHGPAKPLTRFVSNEADGIARSRGQALLRTHWGGFVAAVDGPESVRLLRDPSGTFPCYFARHGGSILFASDAELLVTSGVKAEVDFEEIGRQLHRANVPHPSTALSGIRELLAGYSLELPAAAETQTPCWSPWDHVSDREDGEPSVERLGRTVTHCVRSWASTHGHVLLGVSGGLDSSIVAAALAGADVRTTCLTMFSDDPAGDERLFARALCGHLKLPLIERPYRLEHIDIDRALAPHLPRPRDRTQALAYERVNLEVALSVGADAFMTGNGGDNVFGFSQSAAPVADRYLAEGIGPGLFGTLLDVCRQTGCSLFDALGQAWRLAHRPPAHIIRPKCLFLHPDFVAGLAPPEIRHEWLDAPEGALPGKAAHISTILRAQPTLEADRGYHLPLFSPLMSQPIVESCLKIPSWEWRAGGRDRALARHAFASALPRIILDRRVKGTPSRFAARLLDHFRRPIRERLLGGRLVAERIVDAAALERVLSGERPVPDLERVRILELVNCEAWIGHWVSRGGTPGQDKDIRSGAPGLIRASGDPIP